MWLLQHSAHLYINHCFMPCCQETVLLQFLKYKRRFRRRKGLRETPILNRLSYTNSSCHKGCMVWWSLMASEVFSYRPPRTLCTIHAQTTVCCTHCTNPHSTCMPPPPPPPSIPGSVHVYRYTISVTSIERHKLLPL